MTLPIEIKLDYPIQVGDETINKLVISRRPKARDLKAMDQATGDISKAAALLGELTGLTKAEIDLLDAADFTRAADAVNGFL